MDLLELCIGLKLKSKSHLIDKREKE